MSFLNGTDPGLRQTRTPTTDNFAAGVDFTAGSTTQLTLSADPGTEDNVEITFDGIQQHRNTYSVSGTTVTFDAAIGSGVSNVEATFTTTIPAATPADNSVTLAKMAGGTDGNLITFDANGDPAYVATGTAGQVLTSNGAGAAPTMQALSADDVILLRHELTSGTAGGGSTSGSWGTVPLNTKSIDTGTHCSLSSNQFTLSAGDYEIYANKCFNESGIVQIKLYNTTGTADIIIGGNARAGVGGSPAMASAVLYGHFTIAASQALEIQYRCSATRGTDGLGVALSVGTEVYAQVFLRKVG